MDSSQSNRYLSCIKMSSNSTFVNTFTLQLVMMLILSFHVLFLALYLLNRPFKVDEEKWTRKAIRWIFKKFTFDIYIRIINLWFIFVVLSSMFETYYADTPWISITFFSTVILCVLLYLILWLFQWYATRLSLEKRQECSFRELFIDLKDNNNSGLYALFEFSRISIILICLTYGSAIPFISRSILFSLFQLFYAGVMTKHRPFEKVVWNIMKLVNEFFYFLLSSLLLFSSI